MSDENKKELQNTESHEFNDTKGNWGCLILIICLLVLFSFALRGCISNNRISENSLKSTAFSTNDINKHTFKGEWAFTTENAKIFCVPLGEMTGAKVIINNKEYAITRNITDLPFLPAELWANQKTDGIGCSGAMIEGKCKISLYDMTNYADSICN